MNLKNLSMEDKKEILGSLISSNELDPNYVVNRITIQKNGIDDLIQVVKMVGNETKSAFTKPFKFLVDGFETDKLEGVSSEENPKNKDIIQSLH